MGNRVSYKVIALVCRRFKIDDDVVVFVRKFDKTEIQHFDVNAVISRLMQLYEFL